MGAETLAQATRLIGGRYELEALVGKGGIGEVWRARHVALNSRVAIKFLQLASAQKETALRRFTTEAQITAQLKSAHAVQVFDFGVTDDGQPYLVMELLEGETLGRRLERVKRLTIPEAVRLLGQAARALHRAHALGIVHRDFKPDNIVISEDDEGRDQVKVLDFGVAKLVGALEEDGDPDRDGGPPSMNPAPSLTRTGSVLGTPLYMAPEQIRNPSDVDLKADIWAFGVVAYECLTGRPPFDGASLAELFERIQDCQHRSANFIEPGVPAAFDTWFEIACAPDRARRFLNASVAWKQLTVALDTEGHERSGSFPGLEGSDQSGRRRIVVAPGEERTDASAPTMEGQPGELQARAREDEFHSLRRIPRHALVSASVRPPPPATPAPSVSPPEPLSKRGAWLTVALLGAGAAAGLVVWRAVGPSSSVRAVGPTSSTLFVAPPASAPAAPPGVTAAASAPTLGSTTSAATTPPASAQAAVPSASPSSVRTGTRAAGSGTRGTAASSPAAATGPGSTQAPSARTADAPRSAAPPAPSSTAGFDPGSYR